MVCGAISEYMALFWRNLKNGANPDGECGAVYRSVTVPHRRLPAQQTKKKPQLLPAGALFLVGRRNLNQVCNYLNLL